ncbi:hypothetical protein HN51_027243, partial [Arachis hypogaea]
MRRCGICVWIYCEAMRSTGQLTQEEEYPVQKVFVKLTRLRHGRRESMKVYAYCGSNAICIVDSNVAICKCLKGYIPNPKFPRPQNMSYWSNGCERKVALGCN